MTQQTNHQGYDPRELQKSRCGRKQPHSVVQISFRNQAEIEGVGLLHQTSTLRRLQDATILRRHSRQTRRGHSVQPRRART